MTGHNHTTDALNKLAALRPGADIPVTAESALLETTIAAVSAVLLQVERLVVATERLAAAQEDANARADANSRIISDHFKG